MNNVKTIQTEVYVDRADNQGLASSSDLLGMLFCPFLLMFPTYLFSWKIFLNSNVAVYDSICNFQVEDGIKRIQNFPFSR